jgi:hypothetical protein
MQISKQLKIGYVMVLKQLKLDLRLVAQNDLFSIYEIPN